MYVIYYNDIAVKYYTTAAAVTNPMAAAPRRIVGTSRTHSVVALCCTQLFRRTIYLCTYDK